MSSRIQLNNIIQLRAGQTSQDFYEEFNRWITQMGMMEVVHVPVPNPLSNGFTQKSATHHSVFSASRRERYFLQRVWDVNLPTAAAIMMNPSGASELTGDSTVDFLVEYVKQSRLGYGSLIVANTSPIVQGSHTNSSHFPSRPLNDDFIGNVILSADLVILGWGENGWRYGVPNMGASLKQIFIQHRSKLRVFEFSKDLTFPKHPRQRAKRFTMDDELKLVSEEQLVKILDL